MPITPRNCFWMGLLLVVGIWYRWQMASLAYTDFVFDMANYSRYAKELAAGNWVVDCCFKNLGYSALLAGIYRLFGTENIAAVRWFQVLLDTGSAVLLYGAARSFMSKRTSLIVFLLFLVNPFTAAFTGLVLPETVTIFVITLLAYILSRKSFSTHVLLWSVFGLLLGWFVFIRLSFLLFAALFFVALLGSVIKQQRKLLFATVSIGAFLLASTYTLIGNWRTYGVLSITPPYTMRAQLVYANFFIGRQSEVEFFGDHPEFTRMAVEFDSAPLTQRQQLSRKYEALLWQRIPGEWMIYMKNLARNALWLWDKDHLYTYNDPFYPADKWPLRILNIFLIAVFCFGIVKYIYAKKFDGVKNPVFLFTIVLFCTMIFAYPWVSNESRHTLAFYPLLFLWVGYAVQTDKV